MRGSGTAAVVAAALVACSSDPGVDPQPDAGIEPPPLLEPPPQGEGIQLAMDAPVQAGEEVTYCQWFLLPDGATFDVQRFEHRYSAGSHHLLLFQTTLDQVPTTDRFECGTASFQDLGIRGIAYAAQVPEGELAYPSDVALRLGAGQVVLMQSHYLNTGDQLLDAEVRLNLWTAAAPPAREAGTLFFYDWAIVVPADGTSTAEMRCEIPSDVTLIYAMSHMHRRGVGYRSTLNGGGLAEPLMLYETTSWEEIEPALFEPRLDVTAGQTIEFSCDYANPGGPVVIEGPSADANEMCMFIAAYYPRIDAPTELCGNPGSGPVFHGTRTCGETVSCVQQAGDDQIAAEECLVATCEPSSIAVADFYGCVITFCGNVCPGGTECDECVGASCVDSYLQCQGAACI